MNYFPSQTPDFHQAMMGHCLRLARQARGKTSPNPLVGAVIVKDGEIIGTGFHPQAGQPHAEIFALGEAGARATGATLYVNLEPCNHYGRTPPCTEAIIAAGIKTVVVAMIDPDERVSGQGIERLQKAGLEIILGVESESARQLNEAFIHRVSHRRPFGILKYAMTLDGKIATTTGHSTWVTGEASRRFVHELRSQVDAVIVGGNTVRQDNPHLTTHGLSTHHPLRVVMSRALELPENAHLWETSTVPTLVFTETLTNPIREKQLSQQGVEVIALKSLTPTNVMQYLYERGLSSVLYECGGRLAAKAIAEGMIQKVVAFIAPKIIGGESAPNPVGDLGFQDMTQALSLENVTIKCIEPDVLIQGYLPPPYLYP